MTDFRGDSRGRVISGRGVVNAIKETNGQENGIRTIPANEDETTAVLNGQGVKGIVDFVFFITTKKAKKRSRRQTVIPLTIPSKENLTINFVAVLGEGSKSISLAENIKDVINGLIGLQA